MTFRNLLQKFGAWTTVQKWNEPRFYRLRLKGDWVRRLAIALAVGSLATTLLLVLFAININPPHPLYAFIGMGLVGGLALMYLVRGKSTAGGRVRVCQEGICRRRMYVGVSAQWAEESDWPFAQISQCAVIPGQSINQSFSLLLLTDGSQLELFGVPDQIRLNDTVQFLASKGVVLRHDVTLPPQFTRPISLPLSLSAGSVGLLVLLGGITFYALRANPRGEREVAVDRPAGMPGPGGHFKPGEQDLGFVPNPVVIPPELPPMEVAPPTPNIPTPSLPTITNQPLTIPQLGPTASAPEPAIEESATAPDRANFPAVQPTRPAPVTIAPAVAPAPEANKTELVGGTGGSPFEMQTPNQQPTIGFRYRLGKWSGTTALAQLEPISQGTTTTNRRQEIVVARDGYAVGGIQVDAQDLVQAVRVVFVKRNTDGTLDKTDYYFSDWIGEPTGRDVKTLGKGSIPVIGVFGRRGLVIDAIGLLLAEP